MSFNDTVSDSQLSNVSHIIISWRPRPPRNNTLPPFQVSLGLSQDTTNHILSAAGYINVNDWWVEKLFVVEFF